MSYYSGSNTFPSRKPGFHMAQVMETLPERQQTIRATETTLIAWIELSSIRTIGTIVILKRSYGSALRRLRRSGRTKEGYPRNHNFYSSHRE